MTRFKKFLIFIFFITNFQTTVFANPQHFFCDELMTAAEKHNLSFVALQESNYDQLIDFLSKQFSYDNQNELFLKIKSHFKYSAKKYTRDKKSKANYWLIYDIHTNEIIGSFGLAIRPQNSRDYQWWIDWLAIDKNHRGLGIGKAVLVEILKTARERNIKKLNIYTSTAQEEKSANILYKKMGFKIIRKFKETLSDGRKVLGLFYQIELL